MNKTKWLALATSDERESLSKIFEGDGYEFAIDGYRMHIAKMDDNIDLEYVDFEHKEVVSKAAKINQEHAAIERFSINPNYLIEALQAWADNAPDQPIEIEYCRDGSNSNHFIRVKSADSDDPRRAIITCMLLLEKERE